MAHTSSADDCLQYVLIRPSSLLPVMSAGAARWTLHTDLGLGITPSGEDLVIPPDKKMIIGTGVVVRFPAGTCGRVAPISGLALGLGIDVLGGLIDHDYRGEIKIILANSGDQPFTIRHGDCVAQLILEKIEDVDGIRELSNWQHGVFR